MLVPYIQFQLDVGGKTLPITRVVIGPGADLERNLKSISHFLRLQGIRAKIGASRVPYRVVR
jgi:hypothetical protein